MATAKKKLAKKGGKKAAKKSVAKKPAKKAAAIKPAAKKAKTLAKTKKVAKPAKTAKAAAAKGSKPSNVLPLKKPAGRSAEKKWSHFFTPLDDRVLVELQGPANKTPGGLFIPDTVSEKPSHGLIVAVGRGHRDKKGRMRPLDVQLGDKVLYGQYAGTKVELDGNDFLLLREEDILAVFRK